MTIICGRDSRSDEVKHITFLRFFISRSLQLYQSQVYRLIQVLIWCCWKSWFLALFAAQMMAIRNESHEKAIKSKQMKTKRNKSFSRFMWLHLNYKVIKSLNRNTELFRFINGIDWCKLISSSYDCPVYSFRRCCAAQWNSFSFRRYELFKEFNHLVNFGLFCSQINHSTIIIIMPLVIRSMW